MIILLDTTTPVVRLILVRDSVRQEYEWEAGRGLARGILGWLHEKLAENNTQLTEVSAIGALRGPGSFTGIRIGLTVLNTLADDLGIPIVGTLGDNWVDVALARLVDGENDKIVLPFYDSDARITKPRK